MDIGDLKIVQKNDKPSKKETLDIAWLPSLNLNMIQGQNFLTYGVLNRRKELNLCQKLKFSNSYIFSTKWLKPLIFQTLII